MCRQANRITDGIVFNPNRNSITLNFAYPYEVDLSRIRNERDLLGWCYT
jgi:hypothetical protein